MQRQWSNNGPPLKTIVAALAQGFGVKFGGSAPAPNSLPTDPLQGLGDLPMVTLQRPSLGLPKA